MVEKGIDISNNRPKQLTKEMIDSVDMVIAMVDKEFCPDYLLASKKVKFWDVEDPRHGDLDVHRKARDEIERRVKNLIKEIG
mgnify:FL=1